MDTSLKRQRPEDTDSDDDYGPAIPNNNAGLESDDDYGPSIPTDLGGEKEDELEKVVEPEAEEPPVKKPLIDEATALKLEVYANSLPKASMYERSYMHRDAVTIVKVTPNTDFIITASADGFVKFWKKSFPTDITFVKMFPAHIGAVAALSVSHDGRYLASLGLDKTVKYYDVTSFDIVTMGKLPCIPSAATWVYRSGSIRPLLAVADAHSPTIYLLDGTDGTMPPVETVRVHTSPVLAMAYSAEHDCVVSGDCKGVLEYWTPNAEEKFRAGPTNKVHFKFKMQTDLFSLCKEKSIPFDIQFSNAGDLFAVYCSSNKVRIFSFSTGMVYRELFVQTTNITPAELDNFGYDSMEGGRLQQIEQEWQDRLQAWRVMYTTKSTDSNTLNLPCTGVPVPTVQFDESGTHVLFCTPFGVQITRLITKEVVRHIGFGDRLLRYVTFGVFHGRPENVEKTGNLALAKVLQAGKKAKTAEFLNQPGSGDVGAENGTNGAGAKFRNTGDEGVEDPTIFAAALDNNRFYLLTNREPSSSTFAPSSVDEALAARDVMNEAPSRMDIEIAKASLMAVEKQKLLDAKRDVVMTTTEGEIWFSLFPEETPKTVEVCGMALHSIFHGSCYCRDLLLTHDFVHDFEYSSE